MGWLNDILKEQQPANPAEPTGDGFQQLLRDIVREELKAALAPDEPPTEQEPQEPEMPAEPKPAEPTKEEASVKSLDIAAEVKAAMANFLNKQPVTERALEESYSRLFSG